MNNTSGETFFSLEVANGERIELLAAIHPAGMNAATLRLAPGKESGRGVLILAEAERSDEPVYCRDPESAQLALARFGIHAAYASLMATTGGSATLWHPGQWPVIRLISEPWKW